MALTNTRDVVIVIDENDVIVNGDNGNGVSLLLYFFFQKTNIFAPP